MNPSSNRTSVTPAALGRVAPVDRRLFLKAAALGMLGLTVFGAADVSRAFAAKASDETLAALDSAQAQYEAAAAELQQIGQELEEAQYALAECQGNLDATNQQIADTEATIAQRQQELSDAQDVLASRVRANYTAGSTELIDVLFNSTDFDDFVSRVYYAGKVTDADAAAIQTVKDIKAELESEEAALQEQRAAQEQLVAEQQQLTDDLSTKEASYQDYVSGLSAEVTALMQQAQAELAAAQQAEYEAEMARQAAEAEANNNNNGGGDGGNTDNGGNANNGGGDNNNNNNGGNDNNGNNNNNNNGGYSGGNHVPAVASIAGNYIGVPYVWGGTDPSGFDCSGLAQYCYAQAGYSIGRDTYAQAANISSCGQMTYNMSDLQAGDLVFPHSGHVGICVGGDMMIHAPYPGQSVQYSSIYAFSFGGCPV